MTSSKLIVEALNVPLKEAGFRKKSHSWYWTNDETILVVDLQKSQFGDQYYINFGIGLKTLGIAEFPKEHHCHIRFRLNAIVDGRDNFVESLLDIEDHTLSDNQRNEEIGKLIKNVALPTLRKCATVDGIAACIKDGILSNAMIHKNAKQLVNG